MPCIKISLDSFRTRTKKYLAQICVLHLEKAILQSSTACSIDLISDSRHPVSKSCQSPYIRWSLTAKECFLRQSRRDSLSDESVCFVTEFFNDFMCWCRVEDVMLHWHILVIKLMKQAQGRHVFGSRSISRFAELLCNFLSNVSLIFCHSSTSQKTNL